MGLGLLLAVSCVSGEPGSAGAGVRWAGALGSSGRGFILARHRAQTSCAGHQAQFQGGLRQGASGVAAVLQGMASAQGFGPLCF